MIAKEEWNWVSLFWRRRTSTETIQADVDITDLRDKARMNRWFRGGEEVGGRPLFMYTVMVGGWDGMGLSLS
jgi:hypothetical protein